MAGESPDNPGPAGAVALVGGRYRLDGVLGHGGFGVVHRATDELLQRVVAVKEVRLPITESGQESDRARERVLREARAAGRLHHPGAVAVLDVIDDGDLPWIVMEYVEGQSLSRIITDLGPRPVDETCRVGISLAYALEAAHRLGIVHRDVKPSNVLVTPDGRARLTDFGIAVSHGDPRLTSTGMVLGSPAYLPPERARGDAGSATGDRWGLGATLFTTIEGCPPFAGGDPISVLAALMQGRRQPFRLAGPLAPVIDDLMAPRGLGRPPLSVVRKRLREILERGGERRSSRTGRPTRPTRPRPPARTTVTTPPASTPPASTAPPAPALPPPPPAAPMPLEGADRRDPVDAVSGRREGTSPQATDDRHRGADPDGPSRSHGGNDARALDEPGDGDHSPGHRSRPLSNGAPGDDAPSPRDEDTGHPLGPNEAKRHSTDDESRAGEQHGSAESRRDELGETKATKHLDVAESIASASTATPSRSSTGAAVPRYAELTVAASAPPAPMIGVPTVSSAGIADSAAVPLSARAGGTAGTPVADADTVATETPVTETSAAETSTAEALAHETQGPKPVGIGFTEVPTAGTGTVRTGSTWTDTGPTETGRTDRAGPESEPAGTEPAEVPATRTEPDAVASGTAGTLPPGALGRAPAPGPAEDPLPAAAASPQSAKPLPGSAAAASPGPLRAQPIRTRLTSPLERMRSMDRMRALGGIPARARLVGRSAGSEVGSEVGGGAGGRAGGGAEAGHDGPWDTAASTGAPSGSDDPLSVAPGPGLPAAP
ncbi:protein kinase, partial [Frankia sp. AiPs1]|uniref:serine/threonine-protein kinase n=1 Tax=Frankia sp. AiPs1 TaxID=573493 RepID=UPI0020448466